jgi:hypothetical protein
MSSSYSKNSGAGEYISMGKARSKTTDIHVAPRFSVRLAPTLVVAAVFILSVAAQLTHAAPGDLYVSDAGNGNAGSGNIYKFTPEGIQSTFASGLNGPEGLAFDNAGNLFEADAGSGNIYKFTVPGGGRSTFASGLRGPAGLAFDNAGNLFEADSLSGKIYKFTPGGARSTFASGLHSPAGLAFNAGNLFEADAGSTYIYKFTVPGGGQSTFASGLRGPAGLAFNSAAYLFEADSLSAHIFKFNPAGGRSTFASGLSVPFGLAFDSVGNLFEVDKGRRQIFKFTPGGQRSTFIASGLSEPTFIALERPTPTPTPAVTTNPATFVASNSATLNGLVDPHGLPTTVYFQYGTTTSYGSLTTSQSQTGNTSQTISANIGGLSASTMYHFRIVAHNNGGMSLDADRAFTTLSATGPPAVTTNPATLIASNSAALNGSVDPHGWPTNVYFQYGTTTNYGFTAVATSQSGNTFRNASAPISGLSASTMYHFRIVAHNNGGMSVGPDSAFTTLSATGPPLVTTNPATNVASFSATLNGSVDPHGLPTNVYFQYGTTTSYELGTTPIQSQSGNMFQNIGANISGLSAGATYHFRIVASNSGGMRFGNDSTFTTLSATGPPIVMTTRATNIASSSATLNGTLNPRGLATTVYFQYGTTTSYGLTTHIQSQTGNTSRTISANIAGLSANTLYHFRIVAANNGGMRFDSDLTFMTH